MYHFGDTISWGNNNNMLRLFDVYDIIVIIVTRHEEVI